MTFTVVADANMTGVATVFSDLGEVRLVDGRALEAAALADADILLVRSVTQVNEALLQDSPVRFVGTATSGFDHIDRAYLDHAGIAFSHAPGSNANSVVEYVLSAIARVDDYLERLLAGERVGIIGYGTIGQRLAQRLAALGIDWCAYDPWRDDAGLVGFEAVLECSAICIHAELTEEAPYPSYHLVGRDALDTLTSKQLLLNAGRGAVVDNGQLRERLTQSAAPNVVLDVWEHEPSLDPALLDLCRIGTAHIAGYSYDGKLQATHQLRAAVEASGLIEKSAPVTAPDAQPALVMPEHEAPADIVRALLGQVYDIDHDDRLLRQSQCQGGQGAAGFDRLRKHYRERRELLGRTVILPTTTDPRAIWIRALGAVPTADK